MEAADIAELRSRIGGEVVATSHVGYEAVRREMVFNQLTPARRPDAIVRVTTAGDVLESVRFAREHDLKVAVRGG